MSLNKILALIGCQVLFIAVTVGTLTHGNAFAQDANVSVLAERYDDWSVNCQDQMNGLRSTRICEAVIELRQNNADRSRILGIGVSHAQDTDQMTIIVPLGIALAAGVEIELAKTVAIQMPFLTCRPSGCFARSALNADMVAAFKSDAEGQAKLLTLDGQTILIPFPLKGFSLAHQRLVELSK